MIGLYLRLFSDEKPHVVVLYLSGNGADSRPSHFAEEDPYKYFSTGKYISQERGQITFISFINSTSSRLLV